MSDRIRVFVPTGAVRQPAGADRASGKREPGERVIGLLDNHKHNTGKILDRLQEGIARRFPDVRFVRAIKPEAGKSAPGAVIDLLAAQCEAVVTGIGD